LNPEDFKKEIGENIKKYRKMKGYNQKEFSDMVGYKNIKGNTISEIEDGKHLFPLDKLPKFLEVLDCKVEDLLTPLFRRVKTDYDLFCEEIKQLWNISEAKADLQYGLELIRKAHKEKLPKLLGEEGGEERIESI